MQAGGHSKRKTIIHVEDAIVVPSQKSLSLTQLSKNGKLTLINTKTILEGGNVGGRPLITKTRVQRETEVTGNPRIEKRWSPSR